MSIEMTPVIVASVSTAGVILAAILPGLLKSWNRTKETHKIIVGNGMGDVLTIAERTFTAVGRMEAQLTDTDRRVRAHTGEPLHIAHPVP